MSHILYIKKICILCFNFFSCLSCRKIYTSSLYLKDINKHSSPFFLSDVMIELCIFYAKIQGIFFLFPIFDLRAGCGLVAPQSKRFCTFLRKCFNQRFPGACASLPAFVYSSCFCFRARPSRFLIQPAKPRFPFHELYQGRRLEISCRASAR